MNQERFDQKMERLEKEREEFVSRLTPERQKEFREKEEELNQLQPNNDIVNPNLRQHQF